MIIINLEPGAAAGLVFGDLTSSTATLTVTGGAGAVIGAGTQLALTTGNLTSSGSANLSITGTGTNALLGAGAAVAVTVGDLTTSGSSNVSITGGSGAVWGAGANVALTVGNLLVGSGLSIAGGTGSLLGGNVTISLGTVPIGNGGTGQVTAQAAFDALSPLTTKGDLLTRNGANNIRVAVGADNLTVVADSAQAAGLKWGVLPIAGGGTGQSTALTAFNALSPLTTAGDLLTYSGGNNVRLAIAASNGMLLGSVSGLPAWVKTGYTAAFYTTTAGQTISASSTAIIDFGTKIMDAGNNVTTGASWKFTAPASGGAGTYVVLCVLNFINNPVAIDTAFPLAIHLNGSGSASYYLSQMRVQNGLSVSQAFFGIGAIVLANSDYFDIRMSNNDDSGQSFTSSAGYNQVIIFKVSEATT